MTGCGPVTDTPCSKCGVCPERFVEYDICSMCDGTCHDEIGNPCLHCDHGEETIETIVCDCDRNGDYE